VNEPKFLTAEQIVAFHRRGIEKHGGTLGLRDAAGFDAAVNQPKSTYFYGAGDLFDIAAAYAYHLAESQCFLDGNKRTAVIAALAFLRVNGIRSLYSEEELFRMMIGIAEKRCGKAELAAFFRDRGSELIG
jgi:death on curing protein